MSVAEKAAPLQVNRKAVYLLVFFFVWSLKELWLIEYIYMFGDIRSPLLEAFVKSVIWIVPVWLLIKYSLRADPVIYLKLNEKVKSGLLWGIALSLLLGGGLILEAFIFDNAAFHFSLSFDDYLNTFIMAGLAEEIVFRGLILQEINKRMAFWKANGITALLFLVIHYPIWIYNDLFHHYGSHLYVFCIGLLFGNIFKKTGSLWAVILIHGSHNFFLSII
ncbi:CPBP family intramembrane metalloprotease [Mesobacillus foraminis]|uniref:CPBP family intramembrane glutamic endopeptidase n=1 Tax=Mesobacillus foraminis TaxID=279826 RepID=UPI001BE8338D|nr:CPBP family intramembrane glutamic endopeptidase [Mesobacillus foraminis]MBT2757518.1 CPBP family intramembrane metalloprotease [Mesobacillus foraminis]